jgi:glutamate racemase
MQLVEPSSAVARQCQRVLAERGLLAPKGSPGGLERMRIFTSAPAEQTRQMVQKLLQLPLSVEHHAL